MNVEPERLFLALFDRHRARAGWMCAMVLQKAARRLWGRDVMLYVGGVSFFALLAVFPAISLMMGLYSIIFTPEQAHAQAQALSVIMPDGARRLFAGELTRLTSASARAVSAQSAVVLLIGVYAAHRGFKALLAGLTFIHDEEQPHGFLRFNLLAFAVAFASFALATMVSALIIAARVFDGLARVVEPRQRWWDNEWIWAGLGLTFGLTCVYRYAMSHSGRVDWRASVVGGVCASALTLAASWASAFYVDRVVQLSATYGGVSTVIVFLIWLSWNINAVFFGGALATEVELTLHRGQRRRNGRLCAYAPSGPSRSDPVRSEPALSIVNTETSAVFSQAIRRSRLSARK